MSTSKGFTEIHQIYQNWISQTIRLYENTSHVEFEWQVGPVDVESDLVSRDVVMRFQSDLDSADIFYTDSNGREIMMRRRNFRPTWDLNQTEPIAGNYYPVTSRIFIRDEANGLFLFLIFLKNKIFLSPPIKNILPQKDSSIYINWVGQK